MYYVLGNLLYTRITTLTMIVSDLCIYGVYSLVGGIKTHKQQVIILPGKCYNIIGDRSIFITIFSGALKMHCQKP